MKTSFGNYIFKMIMIKVLTNISNVTNANFHLKPTFQTMHYFQFSKVLSVVPHFGGLV